MEESISVICINIVFDADPQITGLTEDVYKVGKIYRAKYLYEKILLSHNEVTEFEWIVYCSDHDHYQFTSKDFNKFFIDVRKVRSDKIDEIIKTI